MTRLGFLLDSDSCIGCHACTVACKAEHDVPVGVERTWVKYIETGEFPNTSRHFSVMRCNHCDDAPCVTICPTGALFRASNGVIDFDDSNCIGCKACMNACPYDAIYINPETSTAHKCNFCNHRVEVGLLPSCVIVCPTEAIVVGDLDAPDSKLSRIVARDDVAVRAPEQGTLPKVYYRGASQASLDPLRSTIAEDGMIWAETTPDHPTAPVGSGEVGRTTYTTRHPMTWKAMVSSYLVTKAMAGGALIVAALLVLLGNADAQAAVGVAPPIVAMLFTAITAVLLVADLKQPRRFVYLLTRPNTRSWLVRGAWVLGAFALVAFVWFLLGAAGSVGGIEGIAAPGALLGAAVAGYTAFLFAQCEGRDLWQTPLLLPILLAQAVAAGGAVFGLLDIGMDIPDPTAVRWALAGGVIGTAALLATEIASRSTRHVELAVRAMIGRPYGPRFWAGAAIGLALPLILVPFSLPAAAVATLAGMYLYEDAFVRAGQAVPLS